NVPDSLLTSLLTPLISEGHLIKRVLNVYAQLGVQEATWVMRNFENAHRLVPFALLLHIPENTIFQLMQDAIGKPLSPNLPEELQNIKDWINEYPQLNSISKTAREVCLDTASEWLIEEQDFKVGIH